MAARRACPALGRLSSAARAMPAARGLAAAPLRGLTAAPPRPSRGLAAAPPRPSVLEHLWRAVFPRAAHTFFVQSAAGSSSFAEVEVAAGASVAAIVEAATAKLRLDAPPDAVTLSLVGAAPGAPVIDATLSLEEALAAGKLSPRAKLLATVRSPPLLEFCVQGFYGEEEAGVQALASEAEFGALVHGRTMWAVRELGDGGRPQRTMIKSLRAARSALTTSGVRLFLRDVGEVLAADVSNLKRAAKNASTTFEELSNKAAAADARLSARYGALAPVNNGEEVVFVDRRTGKDFASYDGLFTCARGAVVFNEAKASLCTEDAVGARAAAAKLAAIVRDPARYSSRPADVATLIAGRAVVPLLSSAVCDAATAAAAAAARVHVLVKTGAGFACVLAEGEYEAAADDAR